MANYIKGNYKKNVFESANGYIIGLFKIEETNDTELETNQTITFTGYFADLNMNDTYTFYGELIDHPKYGLQYQVEKYERMNLTDKDKVIAFLSSDLFNGIGIKMATKIVKTLGENTLKIIIEDKSQLNKIPNLTMKKANIIYETLIKYEESHNTILYLTELGFNIKNSMSIYNKYREDTIIIIENDIYKILDEIEDISFNKIDDIYIKLNKDLYDSKRVKACVIHAMKNELFKKSYMYLHFEEIKKTTLNYLKANISDELFILYLDELRNDNKITLDKDMYYLKQMYLDEEEILNKIKILLTKNPDIYKNMDKYLTEFEELYNIKYSSKQLEAIKKALENNILIITGGPGTGKTTIINAIVNLYQKLNGYNYQNLVEKVALLAPTGRASKRICEATLFPATTIHRYLKWNKESNSFNINEFNTNKQELIIIDEVSMIDTNLLASLFKGLTNNIKVILVGDYHQLPSVGSGQILKDLIDSKMIDTIELDLLYRQSENSYISELADNIKNDNVTDSFLKPTDNYLFLECSSDNIKTNIVNISRQILEKNYDYKKFQLLAPMYAGINGIDNLNKELQNVFNPSSNEKLEIQYEDIIFRENDKILQLVNMADENVFNGDIGVIKYIIPSHKSSSGKNELYIDYDGIELKLLQKDFNKIKHGYIISIHKSQGSEFDTILMPICNNYKRMLYKKLIYTGITRAKNRLILLGEKQAFIYSVKNNSEILRRTNLKEKLENILSK